MTIIFGITGGICCGKSTVTKLFLKLGVPIVDADTCARDVVVPGSIGLSQIVEEFGTDILLEDGSLNRNKLGSICFGNQINMDRINKIMQPLIDDHSNYLIELYKRAGNRLIGYDASLLVEMELVDKFRPLIVVYCDPEIQLGRLMKRNNLSQEDAEKRIFSQLPTTEKLKYANYLVNTSGTIEQSQEQTLKIINQLKQRAENE